MHLVGFITRIYHDARSSECQILNICLFVLLTSVNGISDRDSVVLISFVMLTDGFE